jgi:hypothetical protein
MSGPDWCRWYASKWLTGTFGLTLEQKGVYITIINIILDRGECPDDERYLCRLCNCNRRRLKRILNELIALGKIRHVGSCFEQVRAKFERTLAEDFSNIQQTRISKRWENKDLTDTRAHVTTTTILESQSLLPLLESDSLSDLRRSDSPKPNGSGATHRWSASDLDRAVEIWNTTLGDVLQRVFKLTEARKATLRGRLSDLGSLDDFTAYCQKIRSTPFLVGDGQKGWRATFDWTVKQANMAKVLEGNYEIPRI